MLGLGETREELLHVFSDLLQSGCQYLTLGQYLSPSKNHAPVIRYIPPEVFDKLAEIAVSLGFKEVAAGPFVRSSYRAEKMVGI
jgi:lipoic acid synthetase